MKYKKRAVSTEGPYLKGETVESIVKKYLTIWEYTFDETFFEIKNNFAMERDEIKKATNYLYTQSQ